MVKSLKGGFVRSGSVQQLRIGQKNLKKNKKSKKSKKHRGGASYLGYVSKEELDKYKLEILSKEEALSICNKKFDDIGEDHQQLTQAYEQLNQENQQLIQQNQQKTQENIQLTREKQDIQKAYDDCTSQIKASRWRRDYNSKTTATKLGTLGLKVPIMSPQNHVAKNVEQGECKHILNCKDCINLGKDRSRKLTGKAFYGPPKSKCVWTVNKKTKKTQCEDAYKTNILRRSPKSIYNTKNKYRKLIYNYGCPE